MMAVGTTLLACAHREDSCLHAAALGALMELAQSGRRWGDTLALCV